MTTMVIDDDPYSLKLMERQLTRQGALGVIACGSARAALLTLEANVGAIDLVFCDLQMPEMDGVQVVRRLAEIGFAGGLALMSGEDVRILDTAAKLAKAHELHVVGALQKPVTIEQLSLVLERHRTRKSAPPRSIPKVYCAEDLRQAIAGGELVSYYQPKVHVASGAVLGVESLVRWRHPQDGMVFPDQFIYLAEEHGLIDALTRVVLTASLRQARQWADAGLKLDMSVNVSMDNLADLQFPEFVVGAAHEAGVPLEQLVIEVTESRPMKDLRAPLDILTRLRLKRVRLSIDDFGTGHSSLAQLRDFPLDEFKIDRAFVHGASSDPALRAIFDASCRMARGLGMQIVAEGVEDRADWDLLRATECDLAQGYFIARPMPGPDVMEWMARWEAQRQELLWD